MTLLNPKFTLLSAKTYTRKMGGLADEKRKSLNKDMNKPEDKIITRALTSDFWTSSANDPYVSLTAHQISENFILNTFTPFCRPWREEDGISHTGEVSTL